jgi:hypothetical protein
VATRCCRIARHDHSKVAASKNCLVQTWLSLLQKTS